MKETPESTLLVKLSMVMLTFSSTSVIFKQRAIFFKPQVEYAVVANTRRALQFCLAYVLLYFAIGY